ncbi:MAG: carboxypeptidase regulatory-like domain-containing protein, partial [Verrucomicrobiota bacterium]
MKKITLLLLLAGSLMPLALAAQNLLVNPGFEEGTQNDAPPWAVGGWRGSVRAVTTEKHTGRRSIMIEGGGDEGGINSVMQMVPIDPTGATQYSLSAWVKLTAPVSAAAPGRTRVRWYFDQGANGAENYPAIETTDWIKYDSGANPIIPPAGATMLAYRQYVYATHPGAEAAYIDDMEIVASPSGAPNYPGVRGTVKDNAGIPVAGAVVFLKDTPTAQEFAISYAVTDSAGNYAVCTANDGDYYVVAWKQGYSLSEEKLFSIANGAALASFNPVLTNRNNGRNLAISTAGRGTKAVDIAVGRYNDPLYSPVENLFDGNTISTRYVNNMTVDPANDRWAYIDLDPVGHATFGIDEFVLRGYGVTLMTVGAEIGLPTDFAIEYTTNDPATETETGWTSHVAYSVSGATQSRAPVVLRLAAPINARAVRLHVTGGSFGPVDFQVNSATLPRGTIKGVVKDATTGAP